MSDRYESVRQQLQRNPQKWLITGVAGFIGSNLLEALLKLDQEVVGLDNFATGHQRNLDEVRSQVSPAQWGRFSLVVGDIRNLDDCRAAVKGAAHVLHEAALGSVPRSVNDPITTHEVNISGFLNMLVAARDARWRASPMRRPARPTATIRACRKSRTASASRCRRMR